VEKWIKISRQKTFVKLRYSNLREKEEVYFMRDAKERGDNVSNFQQAVDIVVGAIDKIDKMAFDIIAVGTTIVSPLVFSTGVIKLGSGRKLEGAINITCGIIFSILSWITNRQAGKHAGQDKTLTHSAAAFKELQERFGITKEEMNEVFEKAFSGTGLMLTATDKNPDDAELTR